ncbi:hypothetical protein ACLOJK_003656 [Asimina triloba]
MIAVDSGRAIMAVDGWCGQQADGGDEAAAGVGQWAERQWRAMVSGEGIANGNSGRRRRRGRRAVDGSSMDGLDHPIQASPSMEKERTMLERIDG